MLERIQKGSTTYAVYNISGEGNTVDYTSLNMINNNQDSAIGLAPISLESMNGVLHRILFDITGRISLGEYLGMRISQSAFKKMLVNLIDTIQNFNEYMIDIHQVILDADSVFINQIDNSVSFLCTALREEKRSDDLFTFFRQIVENSHVETVVNEKDYFHVAWNITRSENGFSLSNLKMVLVSGQSMQQSTSLPAAPAGSGEGPENAPAAPIKYNEPSLVTVTPVAIHNEPPAPVQPAAPIQQKPLQPPIMPGSHLIAQDEHKKGLLGRLFSKKKDDEAAAPMQGGLASLKKGGAAAKSAQPSVGGLAGLKNGIPAPSASSANEPIRPNVNAPGNQPANAYGGQPTSMNMAGDLGTTVLSPSSITPPAQTDIGTTVLNPSMASLSKAPSQPAAQPTAQPSAPRSQSEVWSFGGQPSAPQPLAVKAPDKTILISAGDATTVLSPSMSDATTVLSPSQLNPTQNAELVRIRSGEHIRIKGDCFRIGKERSAVDYFIGDNTAVSRSHASITKKNGSYYVIDSNSTNHTYVNGQMISPGAEFRLSNGVRIRFANEEFEFNIL